MIERLPNLPIARLFLIIGMGYISGKQKMCGFAPGFGLRCAAHWRKYRLDCKRRSTRVSLRKKPGARCQRLVAQARTCLPMCC